MTAIDILLIAALVAFVAAWWLRRMPRRTRILTGLAGALVLLGVAGVLDDRWQAGVGGGVGVIALVVLGVNGIRHAPARSGLPWLSGSVFGLLALGAVAAVVAFPVFPLPKPSGPDAVGVRTFEVTDTSRPGGFAAGRTAPRRLLVRVWYPARSVEGRKPAPYFTKAELPTAQSVGALVGFPPAFTYLTHVRTNSYADAPIKRGASKLPVVFYSHGYTSYLSQNTALMEELASHGYVVFSVQHTYDSAATVFPDGDLAPPDPDLNRRRKTDAAADAARDEAQAMAIGGADLDTRLEGYLRMRELALTGEAPRLMRSGVVWAADRIFVHDQLEKGAVPPAVREIAAAGDLTRVGEMGMSFGGATSGAVCMVDRRCAAGINLDGGDFPFQAFAAEIPVPFLMFHSDIRRLHKEMGVESPETLRSFNEFSYEAFAKAGSRRDIYRLMLKDAQHLGLSDSALFVRRPVRDPLFGATPTDVLIGAQNDFVRGFFDRHLRGRANGFPERQLAAYKDWVSPVGVDAVRAWWANKLDTEREEITTRIEAARKIPTGS